MEQQGAEKQTLYVVATPIGNIGDMSSRALEILRTVDFILCEDTRHSGLLLERFGIKNKLVSYFAHNEALRVDQILPRLCNGESAAVISDAGTPGISDPGARIVDACHVAGIRVSPIPGPSAVASAISAAGFYQCPQFEFVTFFSRVKRKIAANFSNRRENCRAFSSATNRPNASSKRSATWPPSPAPKSAFAFAAS